MNAATAIASLTQDQIESYHQQGFLILRQLFTAEEIAALGAECDTLLTRTELIETSNLRCRWSDHVDSGECMFDCFDPVIDIGPVCRYFARDERILSPLRAIYEDDAYLLKDKLIFKRPGAQGYALHQDYIGWNDFPRSFITVVLAIDPTHEGNGATEVFPGCHRAGYLSEADGDYHELSSNSIDPTRGVVLDLAPGDIALFGGYMPHRSAPNRSEHWRRQLYLSFNADRDGGEQRDAHYRQFLAWLVEKYAQYGRTNVYFR